LESLLRSLLKYRRFFGLGLKFLEGSADRSLLPLAVVGRGRSVAMSLAGISAGYSGASTESLFQKIQEEFQQLGKDLQSGNLTAAQADYVTLQEDLAERDAASSIQAQAQAQAQTQAQSQTQSTDPIAAAFNQLGQDLQSGNLTAAQTDYVTLQQDFSQAAGASSQSGTPAPSGTSSQSGNPIAQEFQQLGKDLQAGNLTAAQADFATLQQDVSQTASSTQSASPIAVAFNQLSQDLQSGNLTAAQQDFTTIQQDFQAQAAQAGQGAEGHHHHGGDSGSGASEKSGEKPGEIGKLLKQLGGELQFGNLPSAQATYTSLEQDFQQFSQSGRKVAGTVIQSSGGTLSVSA
jgi:outer membrane protein assembly factor BamD (BamD/ComL family)